MLLWVIIKTTDNGAKCLLTGLAIILCNQDRWEHYKLQINPFNNEGPPDVLTRLHLLWHEPRMHGVYCNSFCVNCEPMDETLHERETSLTLSRICLKKQPFLLSSRSQNRLKARGCLRRIQPSSSALWEHAYSACLTRTNDGRPSAYMLTAVSCPHPGNDCVINPEPLFKLLLTAEGANGINCLCSPVTNALLRTIWATPAIRHCQRQTWAVGLHMQRPRWSTVRSLIVREPSYGMLYNRCVDDGSCLQITSQFVNSRM